eukprot:Tbor_TRINITY_DN5202_c4_g4::TRINITY_DN5202_c4_g4_i1::g.16677::m.16677
MSSATTTNNNNNNNNKSSTEKQYPAWINMVSGGFGSAFSKTVLSPVQRIVILKQLGDHQGKSTIDLVKMVAEKEGIAQGFWRGNLTSVLIRFPYGGSQFLIYGKVKFVMEEAMGLSRKVSANNNNNNNITTEMNKNAVDLSNNNNNNNTGGGYNEAVQRLLLKAGVGGLSAAISGTLVYPGEIVRLRLMSGDERYRKLIPTIKHIYNETNSPKNFYRGLTASLAQRVPDILVNFAVYETVKHHLDEKGYSDNITIIAGGCCSAVSSVAVCYPLDIVKRRLGMAAQLKSRDKPYLGIWDCLSSIFKENGIKGLYHGAGLEVARCMPQVVIMWYAIEESRKFLERYS